jgi:hypothetical protein
MASRPAPYRTLGCGSVAAPTHSSPSQRSRAECTSGRICASGRALRPPKRFHLDAARVKPILWWRVVHKTSAGPTRCLSDASKLWNSSHPCAGRTAAAAGTISRAPAATTAFSTTSPPTKAAGAPARLKSPGTRRLLRMQGRILYSAIEPKKIQDLRQFRKWSSRRQDMCLVLR